MYTPFDHALETVLQSVRLFGHTERVELNNALGRVLAEEIVTDRDIPPFNRVAMDGYACKREELPGPFVVLETVAAGSLPQREVVTGTCSKVMTGCMLPKGADMVFQVELSETTESGVVRFTGDPQTFTTSNIAPQGEDMAKGGVFLEQGSLISPQVMGILAAVGAATPLVVGRPKVGVLITGDEVLEPQEQPEQHQIRNSNGVQLVHQLKSAGAEPLYYGIIPDDPELLGRAFDRAREACEIVLLSGGVSMGEFDFVPQILTSRGYEILFSKVASKPGRPTTFALGESGWVFGMPGNPVTSFVVFEIMVRPFLRKMMGAPWVLPTVKMPLARAAQIKPSERVTWIPARVTTQGEIALLNYHGSGHFHVLKSAWGLVRFPPHTAAVPQGGLVDVRPL